MNIVFDSRTFSFDKWRPPLQRQLPQAHFFAAGSPEAPADPDYVLLWKPQRLDWSACISLQGAIALGAGLDGFAGLQLPPGIKLQRLADAGMQMAMSEYIHYGVLHFQRGFNHYLNAAKSRNWQPLDYRPAARTRIGILGLGHLGSAVATYLARHGYPVVGWSRNDKSLPAVTCLAGESGLKEILPQCDILVNLLPLTDHTKHLLNREKFAALPRGAGFINASRGAVIVEQDLLDALAAGLLGGALLDVFAEEPLPPSHPFWGHPDIRVTPHISAPTLIEPAAVEVAQMVRVSKGSSLD
ncbi:glyoxylate/hydroxypyruvate reductase A [Exilibacterium tricleocarpae]|uniref:Glyoxylate/hydroxypyruvate reductase A n=1 Tax=Exilibacterium tricleocarpae TaxID=2591008 RepID=A0A545TZD4_9GAMM|nr:NAD(P)-dependent oxidoreductase [Exilibacterium tricleocarpae]TQV82575.1 glyoxylate/hydroxypyruvate reductase A [Exilibacterium tricleocarpae]